MEHIADLSRAVVTRCQTFVRSERGASMVEYALLVALIAMVAIVSVTLFGENLGDKNQGIAGSIQSAVTNK